MRNNNVFIGRNLAGMAMMLVAVVSFGVAKAGLKPSVSENKVWILNSRSSPGLITNSVLLKSKLPDEARAQVQEAYGKLPLSFEENQGQADRQVKFLSGGSGYGVFLTSTETVLQLPISEDGPRTEEPVLAAADFRFLINGPTHSIAKPSGINHAVTKLSMKLLGASPRAQVLGLEALPGKSHYLIGQDPKKWQSNIANYRKVKYESVYPGIDLIYYGSQRQLEYDFVVQPWADPRTIRLSIQGAEKLEIDSHGDLVMDTPAGQVRQRKPLVYQEEGNGRREIAGNYILRNNGEVAFQVSDYDRRRSLVIDPVLVYSTFFGGRREGQFADLGVDVAVDATGSAYITGRAASTAFPTVNPLQPSLRGPFDAFVTKISPSGTAIVYSTYLGGNSSDTGFAIATDGAGNAYVAGTTSSINFPTVNLLQPSLTGGSDLFVAKLNPSGSALVYSTYLGGIGSEGETGNVDIAVDPSGNA